MMKRFLQEIGDAYRTRQESTMPGFRLAIPILVVFTLVFCILSVYIVPSDKPANFNFQEEGALTAMSAIYLSLACGFAIAANLIHFRFKHSHQILWIVLALGLGFFAFDELLQFHERFGRMVLERFVPQTLFRNWNDIIVILYGVAAIPLMALLLPKLLKYKMVPEILITAFLFYVIHTLIDSTQEPKTLTSEVFEESSKLFSTAFLAFACFAGFMGNLWESVGAENSLSNAKRPAKTPSVEVAAQAH